MAQESTLMIWIDLEMTGLDTVNDKIIEMAAIVTDGELNTLAEGPVIAVHQPESVLDAMDDWNKNTHGKSGLLDRVRASRYDERAAELEMLNFLKPLVPARASPMCGNSICQDRRFLARLMPELEAYFHYRNLDVSTIKELARRWAPDVFKAMEKNTPHVALDDIRESIRELRYYRQHFIKS
jgi:oligoribonuclease